MLSGVRFRSARLTRSDLSRSHTISFARVRRRRWCQRTVATESDAANDRAASVQPSFTRRVHERPERCSPQALDLSRAYGLDTVFTWAIASRDITHSIVGVNPGATGILETQTAFVRVPRAICDVNMLTR